MTDQQNETKITANVPNERAKYIGNQQNEWIKLPRILDNTCVVYTREASTERTHIAKSLLDQIRREAVDNYLLSDAFIERENGVIKQAESHAKKELLHVEVKRIENMLVLYHEEKVEFDEVTALKKLKTRLGQLQFDNMERAKTLGEK